MVKLLIVKEKTMDRKFSGKEIKTIIVSAVLLVLGALFCFSLAMGLKAVSYVIGTSLILAGVLCIVNAYTNKKELLSTEGVIGAAIIAFGVLFAGNELTWIIFNFIPFLLMALGVVVIIDAFLKKFKQQDDTKFVLELVIGVISLALGVCLKFIPEFNKMCSVMLGIVLIVYALYSLLTVFLKKDKKKDDKKETEKKEIK